MENNVCVLAKYRAVSIRFIAVAGNENDTANERRQANEIKSRDPKSGQPVRIRISNAKRSIGTDCRMPSVRQTDHDFDRRKFQRVNVLLLGRLMLPDRSEYCCKVVDMSPGSVSLLTGGKARIGERVIAYVDHVGRLEGSVARITSDGFALELHNTPQKRAKLTEQLTWLANKHELNLPEDRRYERVEPRNTAGNLTLEDGRQYRCKIVDLSLSGAALEIDIRPAIGTLVLLDGVRGQVARHFNGGIAMDFSRVQRHRDLKPFLG